LEGLLFLTVNNIIIIIIIIIDFLCDLVARILGYRFRGPGFDSRPYPSFLEIGILELGPLSLVRTVELHE
jgi:hypothetical protein